MYPRLFIYAHNRLFEKHTLTAAHTEAHLCHFPFSCVFFEVLFNCLTFVSFIGIKCHITVTLNGALLSKVKYCV